MGTDIWTYAEQWYGLGRWEFVRWPDTIPHRPDRLGHGPFGGRRNRRLWAVLCGLQNIWEVIPVAPARGLPEDVSAQVLSYADPSGQHSFSWVAVPELTAIDYDEPVVQYEDSSPLHLQDGTLGPYADVSECRPPRYSYREFIGDGGRFFDDLDTLQQWQAQRPTRIVFWFDN